MSESEPHEGFRISRALNAVDREIQRRKRRDGNGRDGMEGQAMSFGPGWDALGSDHPPRADNDLEEKAWRFENAPISTHARLLLSDGISLPAPERLRTAEEIQAKLWEVINGLAMRRVFVRHTNHLTDRELYTLLWVVYFNELTRDLYDCPGSACHIDLLECSSAGEENRLLRNQVKPEKPRIWRAGARDETAPGPCEPSYDRDRYLPKQGLW